MKEIVKPPCIAYHLVAAAIQSTFPNYFTTPSPAKGVKLIVIGTDGITSEWAMAPNVAYHITRQIKGHMSIKTMQTMGYKDA